MASGNPALDGPTVSHGAKVLFLATRDWYNPATTGGDNTMWENARYLASVGHEVTFVAAGFSGGAKAETLEGIHVVRLGGVHSLWLTTLIRYMRQWRGRFDVVVAEGFGGSRIPRFAPLYVKEPIITEWHQIHRDLFAVQYPRLLNGPLNLLERLTAWVHRNTLVRAGTEEWQLSFPRLGFKPGNIFVVPVSIRDDWLVARPAIATKPTIVWLGKMRRYKCPHHAVLAMEEVLRRVPAARLVIAGRRDDLKYEDELRTLAQRLGIGSSVSFQFDLTEAEKRDLIGSARVLVVTSAVEGFGIVVLEANALGVPVVASSGVPEGAVRDGVNGLRYKFGDIAALSEEVVRLLKDDALHSKLSNSARENAEQFRWSRVGAEFERVVSRLIDRSSGPSPQPSRLRVRAARAQALRGERVRPHKPTRKGLPAISRIMRDGVTSLGLATPALAAYRLVTSANPRTVIANARLRRLGAPDRLPIPPANLVFFVAGSTDVSWFLKGGSLAATSIKEAMYAQQVAVEALASILDFACGCGRVLRNWRGLPDTKVCGTDSNPALVEWSRRNLGFADVRSNSLEPPLAYAGAEFDLVYALSVFTHLTQELQTAWMDELSRVLKPGGHLVISTHGERYLHRLTHFEQEQFFAGELVVKGDTKAPGSNTCTAYHPVECVRRLARNLELAAFLPEGARGNPHQDLYVLRKPVGETRR